MKRFWGVLLFGFCLSGIGVFSEAELNLSTLLERFKEHSPNFEATCLSLESARASYVEYISSLYPSVSTDMSLSVVNNTKTEGSYLGTDYTIENAKSWSITPGLSVNQYLPTGGTLSLTLKDTLSVTSNGSITPEILSDALGGTGARYDNTPEIGLTLSQPIFFEDAYGAGKRIAANNLKIAEKNYLSRLNSEVLNLINEYFNLKFLKSKEQFVAFRFNNARASYETTRKRYRLGKVSRLELLKAEASFYKARIDWEEAKKSFAVMKERFCEEYGFPGDVVVSTGIEDLCDYSLLSKRKEVIERALSENINLAVSTYNLKIAEDNLIKTKLGRAPVVTVSGGVRFSTTAASGTDLKVALENSFNDNSSPVLSGSITLSAKLFDAGSFDARLKATKAGIEATRYRLEAQKREIRNSLEDLFGKMEENRKLYEYAKLNLKIAEMEYKKAKTDFNLGRITQSNLNGYNMELENAKLELLNYRMELNREYLNILVLLGRDLLSVLESKYGG